MSKKQLQTIKTIRTVSPELFPKQALTVRVLTVCWREWSVVPSAEGSAAELKSEHLARFSTTSLKKCRYIFNFWGNFSARDLKKSHCITLCDQNLEKPESLVIKKSERRQNSTRGLSPISKKIRFEKSMPKGAKQSLRSEKTNVFILKFHVFSQESGQI